MKKLCYLLTAAAIGTHSLAAQAEAKFGGRMFMAIEAERDGSTGETTTAVSDGNSRIWIMGNEDLGNGTKLDYGLNSFVSFDYNGWATDDSWIGFRNEKWGRFRVGYMSTPLHYMTGYQDAFEGNNHTQTMGRITRFGNRYISLAYDSPEKNGFNYRIHLSPGTNKYKDASRNDDWMFGAGFDYTHPSGFNTHYAVEYAIDDSPDDTKDRQVHSVTVGYDKNDVTLTAGFQYARHVHDSFYWKDETATEANTREFQITGAYKIGAFKPQLGAAYGRSTSGKNYKQVAFNTEYDFSKRTKAYLGAGWVKESRDPKSFRALGLALKHNL